MEQMPKREPATNEKVEVKENYTNTDGTVSHETPKEHRDRMEQENSDKNNK